MMNRLPVIRVFEHQVLRVGEESGGVPFTQAHFNSICEWVQQQDFPFLKVEHQALRFRSYVGVIQCGSLCIEVLPKLDRWLSSKDAIQACLIEMLKVSRFLKIETFRSALVSLRSLSLIDVFWRFFLEEVTVLLREGLIRSYRRDRAWKPYLKGKLELSEQLRIQQHGRAGFYTVSTVYDYSHPLNQTLFRALQVMRNLPLSPFNQQLLGQLMARFPPIVIPSAPSHHEIKLDWKSKRYQNALSLAKMILQGQTPDVKAGTQPGVALVFDMNALFETYIYRQLLQSKPPEARISYQEQRLFWLKRSIKPDIVCRWKGKRVVIDTKWKLLTKGQPAMEDLRQMYVYNKYFRAEKGVLLYPKLNLNESIRAPFHGVGAAVDHGICEVHFIELVKEGRLNLDIGRQLWRFLR